MQIVNLRLKKKNLNGKQIAKKDGKVGVFSKGKYDKVQWKQILQINNDGHDAFDCKCQIHTVPGALPGVPQYFLEVRGLNLAGFWILSVRPISL